MHTHEKDKIKRGHQAMLPFLMCWQDGAGKSGVDLLNRQSVPEFFAGDEQGEAAIEGVVFAIR
ncbi:hypothetical protein [Pseudomonas sp. NPDC099000]|uniref:hypothetical protein n=1 Tax=Pseudomonas sp. NPDC099000 TaxID=3364488 RepID=UPI00383B8D98